MVASIGSELEHGNVFPKITFVRLALFYQVIQQIALPTGTTICLLFVSCSFAIFPSAILAWPTPRDQNFELIAGAGGLRKFCENL
jgi:hypothetical protein